MGKREETTEMEEGKKRVGKSRKGEGEDGREIGPD